jgi:hypothetical protein
MLVASAGSGGSRSFALISVRHIDDATLGAIFEAVKYRYRMPYMVT